MTKELFQKIAKLAKGEKDTEGSFTLTTGFCQNR
jgi:hypothetical protein